MNKLNFIGQLIYFDYQQNDCIFDDHVLSKRNEDSSWTTNFKRSPLYYQSKLSFRSDIDLSKSFNSSKNSLTNFSLLLNNFNRTINSCYNKITKNFEYFSFSLLNSQLSKSSQLYSHSLYNTLNFLIRILLSNTLNCKTYRLKPIKKKTNSCQYSDVNIYSTRKSLSNQYKKQIQLIGRYSILTKHYQSCYTDKSKDVLANEKSLSPRIYYITSLFDEPFLMLRKGTDLYEKYDHPQANMKELRGRIFNLNELEGYCVDLAEKVCSILNITCQFRIVKDGNFGSKNFSTGIWNGM